MDDNNINNIKFAFSPSDNALVQWSEPIVFIIYYLLLLFYRVLNHKLYI